MPSNDTDRKHITGDGSGTPEGVRGTRYGLLEDYTHWLESKDSNQVAPRLDVSNTRLFENRREVIVELHGWTADGEFGVVSYAFTPVPDADAQLRAPEIPSAHEEVVLQALTETGYTLA